MRAATRQKLDVVVTVLVVVAFVLLAFAGVHSKLNRFEGPCVSPCIQP